MDLPAPSLELTTLGMEEGPYAFEREDVDGESSLSLLCPVLLRIL
jgi:hypothetical protein